ncbi:MAG: hypothetical protein ACI85I_000669 [Arenicella sp.]|jgi:hypothetical protein
MNKLWILLPILMIFGFSKKGEVSPKDLQGTWVLQAEEISESSSKKIIAKKFISDTHFTWTKYDEEGTLIALAGGTYMLEEGGIYTEKIEYAFPKGSTILGASIPFDCQIAEKSWKHSGFIQHREANLETGEREITRTERVTEVWKKID